MLILHGEKWFLWVDGKHHPAMNMAIDEELLLFADTLKRPVLRFYSWDSPSMSIGYVQNYASVVKDGYCLVRRPTGGGVVFHDIDLTYTIVIPSAHRIEKLGREESYYLVHDLIIKALNKMGMETELVKLTETPKKRSTMQCFSVPVKFDVALKGAKEHSSSKIAGAAQRRTRNGILHQGSIVIPDIHKKRDLLINSIASLFISELDVAFSEFMPEKQFLDKAASLAVSKYKTNKWNKKY